MRLQRFSPLPGGNMTNLKKSKVGYFSVNYTENQSAVALTLEASSFQGKHYHE